MLLACAAALCLPGVLWAEDGAAQAARLSSVDGQVRLMQDGQTLADPAVANAPLFEGTQVTAGEDGRAEIQFADGSVARLTPNSVLTLSALQKAEGGAKTEIVLESGLGYFELQSAAQGGSMRIRFGDAVVTASGSAVLRINLDNPPGALAVFSGNAHLERGSAVTFDLHGGESLALNAADPAHSTLAESIEPDSWDDWNADRDQALNALSASRTKVAGSLAESDNPAWDDLDASGNWYNVPGTGYVWSPFEASGAGWDPYGSGYWMWTPRFGYIWVSGNSWGYLPYQCGQWNFYDGFGWGWVPGMGACSPWWGNGVFVVNVGVAPGNYRPLRKPFLDDRNPHGPLPRRGGSAPADHGLIPVKRVPLVGAAALPARERNTPVTIAGYTVQAVHPLTPRPQYDHAGPGQVSRARSEYGGEAAKQGAARSGAVYGYGNAARNSAGQTAPGSRPNSSSNSRAPASGGSSTHSSGGSTGPSPSRSSGGGSSSSGGGSSHSSGGGGGSSSGGSASNSGTHR
jgi:hypothetical protein